MVEKWITPLSVRLYWDGTLWFAWQLGLGGLSAACSWNCRGWEDVEDCLYTKHLNCSLLWLFVCRFRLCDSLPSLRWFVCIVLLLNARTPQKCTYSDSGISKCTFLHILLYAILRALSKHRKDTSTVSTRNWWNLTFCVATAWHCRCQAPPVRMHLMIPDWSSRTSKNKRSPWPLLLGETPGPLKWGALLNSFSILWPRISADPSTAVTEYSYVNVEVS